MAGVEIENVDEALAALDRLPKVMQREFDRVASEVAARNAALIRAQAGSGGRRAVAAARSVVASGPEISGGGPFFLGAVFGGQGRPTTMQFAPYVGGDGLWFFTSLSAAFPDTIAAFEQVGDVVAAEWESS